MKNRTSLKVFSLTVLAAAVAVLIPEMSFADSGPFGDTLCGIAGWFQGDTGRAVATIAIIFLGIAAFFGKVTWGLALMFAVGIFAIFGASQIVEAVSSGTGCGGGDS